ncbi:MAG: hypothetical protein ACJARU_002206, partial [Congregibacter sp.]
MRFGTLIPAMGLVIAGFGPVSLSTQATQATQAQDVVGSGADAFAQLGQELPSPNVYRTASGAPGHKYWQQQADYDIDARLDA